MSVQTFDTIQAAREAIMDFRADHFADLPENARERFRTLSASPSPVDQIVGVGEFIYANRADMPAAALDLSAGLIAFAATNGWHGLLENDRGKGIVLAIQRDRGAAPFPGTKFPKADADPAARPQDVIAAPTDTTGEAPAA